MTTRRAMLAAGFALVVLSGAVFRLIEYFNDRSLWLDEAMLYKNVHELALPDLAFGRLRGDQCAPAGFLLGTRGLIAVAGNSEYALRFIPLCAGLAALGVFVGLAWRRLGEVGRFAAVALMAWSWPLVYYSNEFKQYSLDALLAVVFLAILPKLKDRPLTVRRALGFGAAGIAALVLSQTALFLLAAIGTMGLAEAVRLKRRAEAGCWLIVGAAWLGFFALQMGLGYQAMLGNTALRTYHEDLILSPWTWAQVSGALQMGLGASWALATSPLSAWLWALLVVLGGWAAWRGVRHEAVFIGLVVGFTLLASLLGIYPLAVRLLLFLLPLLFWLAGRGMDVLAGLDRGRWSRAVALFTAVLLWPLWCDALNEARAPIHLEHLRPLLAQVAAKAQPQDVVLVWAPTAPAFEYYWARMPHANAAAQVLSIGPDVRKTPEAIAAEVAPLAAGRPRVWLVITHDGLGYGHDNIMQIAGVLQPEFPLIRDLAGAGDTAHVLVFERK